MNLGPGFQVFWLTVICGIQSETTVKPSIGCMNVKGRRRSDSRWTISKEKERGGECRKGPGQNRTPSATCFFQLGPSSYSSPPPNSVVITHQGADPFVYVRAL